MGKKRSTPEQSSDDEIETFYHQRDEQLRKDLEKTTSNKKKKKSVSWAFDNDDDDEGGRDEVLAFDDDSNESDVDQEIDANDDNDEEDEGEEDLTGAWGSERKIFYNEDENENDEDAKLEEQEATLIQKRYYEMLQKKDFALELFQEKPSVLFSDQHLDEQSRQRHIILPDNLADLSVNDRLQLLRDQSPELEILAREFRNLFDDLKLSILPFVHAVIETSSLNEFEKYSGWTFVLTVLELYLVSCSYMSLYLAMKSSDTNFSKHPIENQIEQYRNLCALIHDDFQAIKPDLLKLRELLQERKSNGKIPPPVLTLSNGFSLLKKAVRSSSVRSMWNFFSSSERNETEIISSGTNETTTRKSCRSRTSRRTRTTRRRRRGRGRRAEGAETSDYLSN